jgi:two-component system phosphate regulon sensor histidine kinase PhoR
LFRKLYVTFLGVLAGGLALLGILAFYVTRGRLMAEAELRLEAEIELARFEAGAHREPAALQAAFAALARRRSVRLTLVAADGRVLADSHADPGGMENHNGRPEIVSARVEGRGRDLRDSGTLSTGMLYLAAPVGDPGGPVLRAALSIADIESALAGGRRALLSTFAIILLAAGVLIYVHIRRITLPLQQIRFVADWIAAGDFSRKAPEAADEVGSVSQAINHMAEELARRLESLRTERSRIETVLSGMEEGVLLLDGAGQVLHANGATRSLFQLSHEPVGLPAWEALRLHGLQDSVQAVLQGGSPVKRDFEVGPRTLSLRISPLSAGRGAVLVAHDITEDRRYDDLRKEFVANVSHELRTPLTMIQGYVETLLEGAWKEEGSALEFLGVIDRNVKRLSAIVRDLLDLSRLESGGRWVQPVKIDLAALVQGVADTYRPLAERRRQAFLSQGTGEGVADPALLDRALSNLAENAIKYTPEGGTVEIRARREADRLVFEVQDNGSGIPESDLPRIFERFYRVEKSRARDLGGTGLGLAIVKHVAQVHGGNVSVRSEMGKGSTFTLQIPTT